MIQYSIQLYGYVCGPYERCNITDVWHWCCLVMHRIISTRISSEKPIINILKIKNFYRNNSILYHRDPAGSHSPGVSVNSRQHVNCGVDVYLLLLRQPNHVQMHGNQ